MQPLQSSDPSKVQMALSEGLLLIKKLQMYDAKVGCLLLSVPLLSLWLTADFYTEHTSKVFMLITLQFTQQNFGIET